MNDFVSDDEFQKDRRDAILIPQFYGRMAFNGRYVVLDRGSFSKHVQTRMSVDTVFQGINGNVLAVEEKIVRWPEKKGRPHECFTLETHSCTLEGYERDGWMKYGIADRLMYCFQTECGGLDCHWMDFRALQAWFWPKVNEFRIHRMDTKNRSQTRLVPIADVITAVAGKRYFLENENVATGPLHNGLKVVK